MNVQRKTSAVLPPIKSSDAHWIEGWVGPIAVLDVLEKKNSLEAAGNDSLTVQPVAQSLHLLHYSGFCASCDGL